MTTSQKIKLMGRIVIVEAEMTRQKAWVGNKATVTWKMGKRKSPRPGWIVGFSFVRQGEVSWYPDEGPIFTDTDKRIPVVLVAYWPTEKPIRIPGIGFHLPENGEYATPFCSSFGDTRERQEESRKFLSNYSKEFKRDSRGRFIPE